VSGTDLNQTEHPQQLSSPSLRDNAGKSLVKINRHFFAMAVAQYDPSDLRLIPDNSFHPANLPILQSHFDAMGMGSAFGQQDADQPPSPLSGILVFLKFNFYLIPHLDIFSLYMAHLAPPCSSSFTKHDPNGV